ncbi:hypothetical protein [uncultured Thermanaerothrix sp.]|uniref:hypothetical protein n=1 Tax=uncultured Thermanaerothrix sp. TaxID=1195149 RepID=UPI002636F9DD|nr:hypothetical protein [uncultured Thermanaerothrix sp.]
MVAKQMNNEILQRIEEQLRSKLHPVDPDPQFVVRLQRRLTTTPRITLDRSIGLMGALLSIGAGVFLGALLLWFLHRPARSAE